MKINLSLKIMTLIMAGAVLFSSCASSTMITSNPTGAKVSLDAQQKGVTPYEMRDKKASGAVTQVLLSLDGYDDLRATIKRNEEVEIGAVIGGLFFLIPFAWVMGYNPVHNYELLKKK